MTSSEGNLTEKENCTCLTLVIAFRMFYDVSVMVVPWWWVLCCYVFSSHQNAHSLPLVVRYGIAGSMPQADSCPSSHYWKT